MILLVFYYHPYQSLANIGTFSVFQNANSKAGWLLKFPLRAGKVDCVRLDVAEEVVAAIRGQEQDDAAYERRKFRHKAHYSLNRADGIENDALNRPLTPAEVLEQKLLREEVYAALMQLTAIQARRIYARFYLGMTVAEIARIEGADRRRVWESIRRGLKKLARLLDTAQ